MAFRVRETAVEGLFEISRGSFLVIVSKTFAIESVLSFLVVASKTTAIEFSPSLFKFDSFEVVSSSLEAD